MLSPHCPHAVPMLSPVSPCGLHIPVVPMLSPHCPHVVPIWSAHPHGPHVDPMLSPHCPHVVPIDPHINPPIHQPIGGGVSTNHKSSNRIELSRLGPDLFNF